MDDIFMVLSQPLEERLRFVRRVVEKSKPFVVKVEEVSSHGVQFLDLFLYFGERYRKSGFLDFRVHIKCTNISTPLLPTSLHPPSVHRSWPSSLIFREKSLTSSTHMISTNIRALEDRWNNAGVLVPSQRPLRRLSFKASGSLSADSRVFRIVLPYFPRWAGVCQPLLDAVRDLEIAPGLIARGEVAYMLGHLHLVRTFMNMSTRFHVLHRRFDPFHHFRAGAHV